MAATAKGSFTLFVRLCCDHFLSMLQTKAQLEQRHQLGSSCSKGSPWAGSCCWFFFLKYAAHRAGWQPAVNCCTSGQFCSVFSKEVKEGDCTVVQPKVPPFTSSTSMWDQPCVQRCTNKVLAGQSRAFGLHRRRWSCGWRQKLGLLLQPLQIPAPWSATRCVWGVTG